jgi:hypothetical protein
VARGKFQSYINFRKIILGSTKDVNVLYFVRHTLDKRFLNTKEGAQGHKVIHRVENWGTSYDPFDIRFEPTHTFEQLGTFVSDLMSFIKYNPIPGMPVNWGIFRR